jgi:hypothetical protein
VGSADEECKIVKAKKGKERNTMFWPCSNKENELII